MIYGSVCSGIEAATVAWHPLGWRPSFFAEIDRGASAVLAHHYPHVPNLGDFTKIEPQHHEPIDLLVGGTPCQSFSVAGLRGGMADARGNLALEFLLLARRARARWLVWENVPGVLSSNKGRDFGSIIGGMVELGYGVAYRVLDAQFVRVDGFWRAVPQRRRRVFVVGYLGDWRRAAAVLFERASLLGHSAPRRETGEGASYDVAPCIAASGRGFERTGDTRGPDCLIASSGDISHYLNAGGMGRQDFESETLVAHALRGDGFDASEDGTGRGTPIIPIAFDCKASGRNGFATGEISPTLRSMSHNGSHQNGGGQVAVAFGIGCDAIDRSGEGASGNAGDRAGLNISEGLQPTLRARSNNSVAAVGHNSRWAVRRLTPRECERLQGFPDDYTLVPVGKRLSADGPRYKQIGNSMAVPVMRWIGTRIASVAHVATAKADQEAA